MSGAVLQMPRGACNPNPEETCSAGIQVAAFGYLDSYCGRACCALVVSAAPATSGVPMNLRRVSMMVLLDGAALWQRFVVGILQPGHGKRNPGSPL